MISITTSNILLVLAARNDAKKKEFNDQKMVVEEPFSEVRVTHSVSVVIVVGERGWAAKGMHKRGKMSCNEVILERESKRSSQ